MKKIIFLLVLFVCSCQIQEKETKQVEQPKAYKIISNIDNVYSYGSCFFINWNNKKYIITAYHVVDDNGKIILKDSKDNLIEDIKFGKKQYKNNLDVAIFEIISYKNDYYFFDIKTNNNIKLLGFPNGKTLKINNGKIETFETNGEIIEGMSGGVVVDEAGKAIGVISARFEGKVGGLFINLEESLIKILEN